LEELVVGRSLDFYKELLIRILLRHGTTIISKNFLLAYTKYLEFLSLKNWEEIFEAIKGNKNALERLLYFSFHFLKIDFFNSFPQNTSLSELLNAVYTSNRHNYQKLDYTVKREVVLRNFNLEHFEKVHENLVKQGAESSLHYELNIPDQIVLEFDNPNIEECGK
jgi:hypothetical protein